ncbi:MAG: peptidoglycan D,D-transpeptidase FtsI family protein [Aristaeellaceae bacterium]
MSQTKSRDPQKKISWRYFVFIIILLLMFTYLASGLVRLQLLNSEEYATKAESVRTKTISIVGVRGNITDADSVILAKDEKVYNVTFYKDASNTSRQDYYDYSSSIVETLEIIERNGGELAFDYVIRRNEDTGEWEFNFGTGVSDSVLETRESQWRSNNYVTARYYPTAEDCLRKLKKTYRIAQTEEERQALLDEDAAKDRAFVDCLLLDEATMLKVMAVYSEMQMNVYNSQPIPIAKNVKLETVFEIETRSMTLPGMAVSMGTQRVYPKHSLAAQIIGYTGKIPSRTKWLELQQQGYSYNDTIGRDGIESSMESWLTQNSSLRKGSRIVERNNWSTVVRELSYTEPQDGNNVKLTLKASYQQAAERCVANNVEKIRDKQEELMVSSDWLEKNRTDIAKRNWEQYPLELAEHGVMVVLNVEDDTVLAMANFPTYDLNALVSGGAEARAILADDRNLMLNYAIGSRATPGSIFKMVTGFGVLDTGELGVDETFSDLGYYTKYNADLSTAPKCWVSNNKLHLHQTIVEAIKNSCNYFFYEMADRLGEDRLYRYATEFGLTSKTGIELPGEVRSVVGSQDTLYDPTKAMGESSQDTSLPIIVFNSIKKHLRQQGAARGYEYSDEKLSTATKRLMDMAVQTDQEDWIPHMRTILMEELNMTKEMVYSASIITDTYNYMNDIKWGGQQTILCGIGQSVTTVTPIAVARYVAAIANGGYVYNVSIVDSIISPDGDILFENEKQLVNQLEDNNGYLAKIREGMAGVTDDTGTAKKYFTGQYAAIAQQMGAKTGTAQVTSIDLENNAWFVCFAPLEDPEIAVVVFVPHGYSGGMASIGARDFVKWYLEQTDLRTTDYVLPAGNSLAP